MEEKKNSSKRKPGYILLAVGVLLLVMAVYMYMQTRGTNLLYADAVWGKIYLYYWVPGVVSIGFGVVGGCILKKNPKPQVELLEETPATPQAAIKDSLKNSAKVKSVKEVSKEDAKQEPKENKKETLKEAKQEVSVLNIEELKCEKCGAKLVKGAKFCGACGTPVQKKEQPVEKSQVKEEIIIEPTADEKSDAAE